MLCKGFLPNYFIPKFCIQREKNYDSRRLHFFLAPERVSNEQTQLIFYGLTLGLQFYCSPFNSHLSTIYCCLSSGWKWVEFYWPIAIWNLVANKAYFELYGKNQSQGARWATFHWQIEWSMKLGGDFYIRGMLSRHHAAVLQTWLRAVLRQKGVFLQWQLFVLACLW